MPRLPRRLLGAGLAVGLVLVPVACGDDDAAVVPASLAEPNIAVPGEVAGEVPEAVDWGARTVSIDEPGWSVEFCEGEGPFLCVERDGSPAGTLELLDFPVESIDALAAARAEGRDESEALNSYAGDFLVAIQTERSRGCGEGYQVVGDDPTTVTVANRRGLRYGLRGVTEGRTVELVVGHAVVAGDTLYVLNAAGYAEDGCLGRESEFTPGDLEAFLPLLSRIAAGSVLPEAGTGAPADEVAPADES